MLPARTAKYGSNLMFNVFEVISRTEVEDQAGKPGVWRLGLPHACDGIAGELTDYRIDKTIWNIDGKLVPRHEIRNLTEDLFYSLQNFFLYRLIIGINCLRVFCLYIFLFLLLIY